MGSSQALWDSPYSTLLDLKAELTNSSCAGLLVINKIASAGKLSFLCSSKVLKLSQSFPALPGFRLGSRVSVGGTVMSWKVLPQALNPACFGVLFIYVWGRVSLCSLGCPQLSTATASASRVLGLQKWGIIASFLWDLVGIFSELAFFPSCVTDRWCQLLKSFS